MDGIDFNNLEMAYGKHQVRRGLDNLLSDVLGESGGDAKEHVMDRIEVTDRSPTPFETERLDLLTERQFFDGIDGEQR